MNELINIITIFLTFASVVMPVILYYLSIRKARPLYYIQEITVNKIAHPSIKLFFEEEEIQNLQILRWCFWNGGKKTLTREEALNQENRKLKLVVDKSYKILDLKSFSNISNEIVAEAFDFNENDNSKFMYLNYQLLNKEDGLCGEIYYTKTTNGEIKPKIVGTFNSDNVEFLAEGEIVNTSKFDSFFFCILEFFLLFMLSLWGYMLFKMYKSNVGLGDLLFIILAVCGFLFMLIFNFKNNIAVIPKKIPSKYKMYLKQGSF